MGTTPDRAEAVHDGSDVRAPKDLADAIAARGRCHRWTALDRVDQRHIIDLINETYGVTRKERIEVTVEYVLAPES